MYNVDSFYYKLGEISNFIQCMCGLVNLGLAIDLYFTNVSSGRSFLIFVVFYELLYTIPEWLKHYFLCKMISALIISSSERLFRSLLWDRFAYLFFLTAFKNFCFCSAS
ncbi:hypothetical protein PMAYCL1PPCAC_26353, partial [Pristionchus mayeri]